MKNTTGAFGDKLVDYADIFSQNMGYNVFGFGPGNYIQAAGEGFEEYDRQRGNGIPREIAAKRAIANAGVSFAGDKLLDKSAGRIENKLFNAHSGAKADFKGEILNNKKSGTVIENFFGEKKEITADEYDEVLQFKNFEDRIEIQNGISCFPKTDLISENVKNVKPITYKNTGQYCFDIGMHGNANNVAFASTGDAMPMTAKALAISISQNTNYKKGQPVRLLSCSTGKPIRFGDCFAQKLANEINAPVIAPTDVLFINKKGIYTIGKNNTGNMAEFLPVYKMENNQNLDWRTLNGGRKR